MRSRRRSSSKTNRKNTKSIQQKTTRRRTRKEKIRSSVPVCPDSTAKQISWESWIRCPRADSVTVCCSRKQLSQVISVCEKNNIAYRLPKHSDYLVSVFPSGSYSWHLLPQLPQKHPSSFPKHATKTKNVYGSEPKPTRPSEYTQACLACASNSASVDDGHIVPGEGVRLMQPGAMG